MKHLPAIHHLFFVGFLAGGFLHAQEPAIPDTLKEEAQALSRAALEGNISYDIVESLTTEVGQRLAGSEAEKRARDWGVAKLKELGFENVHVEPFEVPL